MLTAALWIRGPPVSIMHIMKKTVMNTIESNDETVIGGLSQGDDAAKLRALYPTEKGESPV